MKDKDYLFLVASVWSVLAELYRMNASGTADHVFSLIASLICIAFWVLFWIEVWHDRAR